MTQKLEATCIPLDGVILLRIIDPEDGAIALGAAGRLLDAVGGATAAARLYEPKRDTTLRSDVTTGGTPTVIPVQNAGRWAVGMTAEIELDDDFAVTRHVSRVDAVDLAAGELTIATAVTGDASKGQRVRRILLKTLAGASSETMLEYGTPAENDETWGFSASIAQTWEIVGTLGAEILAEMKLDAAAASRTWFELFRIVAANR